MSRVECHVLLTPHVALTESIVMSAEQIGQQEEGVDDGQMLRRKESYQSKDALK